MRVASTWTSHCHWLVSVAALTLAVALWAPTALGACPNQCSRHGTCTSENVCVCFDTWTGADCSLSTCQCRAMALGNECCLLAAVILILWDASRP